MKRVISIVLAAILMVGVLSACGAKKDVDFKTVMSDINSKYSLSGLKTLESTDDLNRYYAINTADIKQFAAELSTAASQYTEIVLVEANDQTAADNVKKQLEAHLAGQLSNAKSYDADQVAMIESCSVKQTGNFVYLVVSDKFAEITGEIEAALK